jgi:hypothetical protein
VLTRLPQWTGGGSSLRPSEEAADPKPQGIDAAPPAESHVHTDGEGHQVYGWAAAGDDDMRRPGERLHVYRSQGDWRGRDGKVRRTIHGFNSEAAYSRGEIVLSTQSLWLEAAALSFMREGPHDVRPALLLAMFAEDERAIVACLVHGWRYVSAWCWHHRKPHGEATTKAAAADALALIFRRRAGMSADARARSLRMRAADYRALRLVALRMYRQRLREAAVRYHTGRIHPTESLHSKAGRSSPPASNHPRALPRDTGQQLTMWAA